MARSAPEQVFVDQKIDQALADHDLPVSSPIRGLLERDCEIFGIERNLGVRINRPERYMSLAERLDELASDPMLKHNFPTAKPTVRSTDMKSMSQNFDAIRTGAMIVEK